ncbi:MAG: O-antigen ligase family protein [Acidobacteriota bacterium]
MAGRWPSADKALDWLSRVVAGCARTLVPAGCILAWQSLFWIGEIPAWTKVGYVGLTLLSAARPADGLLAVAGLAILGGPLAGLTGAIPNRGPESIVLAFLTGWLARVIWRRERNVERPEGLSTLTMAFGALVVASLLVTEVVRQRSWGPPLGYGAFLFHELVRHYLDVVRPSLSAFYESGLLLEGGLLLMAAVALSRRAPDLPMRLLRMLVVSTAAAAVLSCVRLAMGMLRNVDPMSLVWRTFTELRLTFHVSDVNAAGSHFAMVIVALVGMVLSARRLSWVWSLAWLPLLPAVWLTGSRAAVLAILLVPVFGIFHRRWRRAFVFPVAAACVVLLFWLWSTRAVPNEIDRINPATGVSHRLLFLQMSWRIWQEAPVFGVGIGQYQPTSERFMPPDLRALYLTENAHNNFAQIGVELGPIGLMLFLGILATAFRRMWLALRSPREGDTVVVLGTALGLAAFLLTCLTGHPLLVAPVSVAFWLTTGAGVAIAEVLRGSDADRAGARNGAAEKARYLGEALSIFVLLLAVSVPIRAALGLRHVDLSGVRYGFESAERDRETGEPFRLAGPRATVFVPGAARVVTLAVAAERDAPGVELALWVDGRLANRVMVRDATWRDVSLLMPTAKPSPRFRRLDIGVFPLGTPSRPEGGPVGEPSLSVRVRSVSFYPP